MSAAEQQAIDLRGPDPCATAQGNGEDTASRTLMGTIRKGRKEYGLHNAENRSAGAYTKRHHRNHRQRKARILPEQPEGVSEVFCHVVSSPASKHHHKRRQADKPQNKG
jgi:hypothetical protein